MFCGWVGGGLRTHGGKLLICSFSCPQFVLSSLCFHSFERLRRRSKNIKSLNRGLSVSRLSVDGGALVLNTKTLRL